MALELAMSCGDYDRTRALVDGTVRPEGISWRVSCYSSPERHHRMLVNREFDVSELSLSSYLIARERGVPLQAIPVFPHRRFRHGFIFVLKSAGIKKPQDLEGKRVGIRRYQNTASVWVRGILADEYRVDRHSIHWFTEGDEEQEVTFPAWLSCTRIPKGTTLDSMISEGKLDAVIYPEVIPSIVESSGQVGRLFPNYKQVETDYFKRTGIFPPMHTVVIKAEVLERHPWVAASVWKAFQQAKVACQEYWSDQRRSSQAWFGYVWEEQRAILGEDPWPYDLEHNRKALETLSGYMMEDGLLSRMPRIEDEFLDVAA